ncbi:hypothetical protein BGAL_0514g00030 [Botrytis galanthina]|uniref:Uncharacterized protein n=1 Tax=Botrytis galanthina TaxID=278940 RepID=A0A4S8QPV1_9HELO|nr:hypothetical protein BGAL_0514g00030 [Botrytis galanthina]
MKTTLDPRFPSEGHEEYGEKSRHDSSPMEYGIAKRQNVESPWDVEKNIRRNSSDGTLRPASEFEEVTSSDLEEKMCEKCEKNKRIAYSWNPTCLCLPWLEWMHPIFIAVVFFLPLVVLTVSKANEMKGLNPNESISKTPLAGMTHIGSFDLRHADLNTTMPWPVKFPFQDVRDMSGEVIQNTVDTMFSVDRRPVKSSGMLYPVFNFDYFAMYQQISNQNLKVLINTPFAQSPSSNPIPMLQNITRLGPVDFEHLNLPLWLCVFIDSAGPHTQNLLESGCKDVTWMYQTYAGWISLAMVIIYFSGSFVAFLIMIGILYGCGSNLNCIRDKRDGIRLDVTEGLGQKLNVRKDVMTIWDTSEEEKGQISSVWLREDNEDEIREKSYVKIMLNGLRSSTWTDPQYLFITMLILCMFWFFTIMACALISFIASEARDWFRRKI